MADDLSFDLLAASLRQDGGDISAFLEILAKKLEDAIPSYTTVERRGRLFSKVKPVAAIHVLLGDMKYSLFQNQGHLEAQRIKLVRDIALKTETVPLDQWIERLSQELLTLASQSTAIREGLERFLLS